jgi:hypothetical protein
MTFWLTRRAIPLLLAALALATVFSFWRPDIAEAWFTALGAGAATYLTWGLWKVSQDQYVIERCYCRLKDFRRIATRSDKLARNYFSALCLVAAVAFWL